MFKLDLEKVEEPEIKLPTSVGSSKKQDSSRKTFTSALLTVPMPFTVWITTNWKILQEREIPDHLTCLLRNLYAGLEATVRTGVGHYWSNLACTGVSLVFNFQFFNDMMFNIFSCVICYLCIFFLWGVCSGLCPCFKLGWFFPLLLSFKGYLYIFTNSPLSDMYFLDFFLEVCACLLILLKNYIDFKHHSNLHSGICPSWLFVLIHRFTHIYICICTGRIYLIILCV